MPRLAIRCLGALEVARGSALQDLPPSRKARALLGYLVVTGREHSRSRLSSLLWDVADDPRGGLRWSLSRLRALVDDAAAVRLDATRTDVRFVADGADVDVDRVRRDAGGLAALDVAGLEALVAAFRGELLEDLDQPELHAFQAWLIAERDGFRRIHGEALARLVERLRDQPARAIPHARARLAIAGHDERAHVDLIELLAASGARELAQEQLAASRRQLEASDDSTHELHLLARRLAGAAAPPAPSPARQQIRFCRSRDGTQLAYTVLGSGPPLVKTSHWLSHLEYELESPVWRHWVRELSRDRRLVRFDQRGNGMSQRDVTDVTVDRMVEDLEAVVDAVGLDRFPLLGISQGCAYSIAFAAAHPERVTRMVLCGGFARLRFTGGTYGPAPAEPYAALIESGWGQDNPAVRQLFTTLFLPDGTREQQQWFNELQARTASPAQAARLLRTVSVLNVEALLPAVRVPTLVIHVRSDAVAAYSGGVALAAGIPGARLVSLDGKNHILLEDEPAWPQFLSELRHFLDDEPAA